jgi:murein L,D-transpeptidase YcbB/YkuD
MRKTGVNAVAIVTGLVIVTLAGNVGCRRGPQSVPEIQALLSADTLDRQVGDAGVRRAVRDFYARTGMSYAWSRDTHVDAALAVLASAADHGLSPDAYQADGLASDRELLSRQKKDDRDQSQAVFDVRMTTALIKLGRDVAIGRTSPQSVDRRWKVQRALPDLAASLAASRDDIGRWLDAIQPPHDEYAALRRGLAALRGAEAKGGWPGVPASGLRPGASSPAVAMLRKRLAASGDLGSASVEGTRFDQGLGAAVRVFQEHHGLPSTGRVDEKTLAALNVPLDARIRQVVVNLERWRYLPDDLGARHFRVNIPYFHLEARERNRVVLDIRAVVGKPGNETPVFSERMTHVVLSPYWNIPPTIATDETLPAIAQDPGFLERQNIEVVRVSGSQADVVDASTVDWEDEGALDGLRFRQRPGAANALGFVKFMFPNSYNVYVHDTPSDALFARLGRAFSHGCVRVEEPVELAKYVLRDQEQWTAQAIDTAMHAGSEHHVKLRTAIPIHIVYFTSWVDDRGGLHFRDDVYGYDAKQTRILQASQSRRPDGAKPRPRPGPAGAETFAKAEG